MTLPAPLRPSRYIPWEGVIAIDREFQLRLYDFSHGPVVLEVATESASSGAALTAVPCLGNEPLGTGCVDNFRVGRQVTGVRSSAASPAAQETMLTAARKFLAVAKPAGPCTLVFAARPAKGADAPPEEIRLVDVQGKWARSGSTKPSSLLVWLGGMERGKRQRCDA